jgi:hypothetical protein
VWALAASAIVFQVTLTAPAAAQTTSPDNANRGAIRFRGGIDAPTVFVFRGIVQEGDPKLTLFPYGELGILVSSGAGGGSGAVQVNLGVWNSLNTGSSGSGGPLRKLHYAEHFYSSVALGMPGGITVAPGYRAITSPSGGYQSVGEIDLNVSRGGRIAPYGFLALEVSDKGQLDEGSKKGTYFEAGATPNFGLPFARARLGVPVNLGVSLSNYYELFGNDLKFHDHPFGFFNVGGVVTAPLSTPSRYGQWSIHGGVQFLEFGDTTKAFNGGKSRKTVGFLGFGLIY